MIALLFGFLVVWISVLVLAVVVLTYIFIREQHKIVDKEIADEIAWQKRMKAVDALLDEILTEEGEI